MKQDERHALAAVAFFPRGVARSLLEKERYEGIGEAVITLLDLGLVERIRQTLYLLPPVRDYVHRHLSLPAFLADSLAISCWQWMEDRCKKIGSPRGSVAIRDLVVFSSNFESALLHGLQSRVWKSACHAVSRYASAGRLGMFGNAAICETAVGRVEQEIFSSPNDESLHVLKARMLRAVGQQYEKSEEFSTAEKWYSRALAAILNVHDSKVNHLRARLTKDLADVAAGAGVLNEATALYEKAKGMLLDCGDDREAIECSLGLAEVACRQESTDCKKLIQMVDDAIAEIGKRMQPGGEIHQRWLPVDFERTEAKAYLVASKITATFDHDRAVNCSIKALFGFSAAADTTGTMAGLSQLLTLILSSRDSARCAKYVRSKLSGNPNSESHKARARSFSFHFYRFARQSASSQEAQLCLELAGQLKAFGRTPSHAAF